MADRTLYGLSQRLCLVMAVDQDQHFLRIGNGAYAYAQCLSGNRLGIVAEEAGVDDAGVGGQVANAGAGRKAGERLVERDMTVNADAAHEQVDTAVGSDLLFIARALTLGIVSHAVEDVDVLGLHVNKMIKEIVMHEVPVALVMLVGQTEIFIHVEGHDILKADLACLVHADKLLVNADGRGACGQTKDERTIQNQSGLMIIDLVCDIFRSPFAHIIVVFLNYNSHNSYLRKSNSFYVKSKIVRDSLLQC